MSSRSIYRLFLFTIVYLVSFDLVFTQEPQTIDLPCTDATPNSTFCMGSLGDVGALTGSGCMADKNCEAILIGKHDTSNGTIQWELMTTLPTQDNFVALLFYALHDQHPGTLPDPLPPKLQNVSTADEFCPSATAPCKFCSKYGFDNESLCSYIDDEYKSLDRADTVNLNDWKSNPFRRVAFESKTIIEVSPYRVDFLSDTVWPYLEVEPQNKPPNRISVAGLSEPVRMFCESEPCQPSSVSTPDTTTIDGNGDGNGDGSGDGSGDGGGAGGGAGGGGNRTKTTPPPSKVPSKDDQKQTGIIIGSVIGGILLLVILVGVLIWFVSRKKAVSDSTAPSWPVPNEQTPNEQTPNEQTPNQQTPNQQTPNQQTPNQQTPKEQVQKTRSLIGNTNV